MIGEYELRVYAPTGWTHIVGEELKKDSASTMIEYMLMRLERGVGGHHI